MPARTLPRPFSFHWGSGQIIEEATFSAEHHEPAIQLLKYDEGDAARGWAVRFCFYNPRGQFQRSPMLMGEDELKGLRAALRKTPKLRKLLQRLVQ